MSAWVYKGHSALPHTNKQMHKIWKITWYHLQHDYTERFFKTEIIWKLRIESVMHERDKTNNEKREQHYYLKYMITLHIELIVIETISSTAHSNSGQYTQSHVL